MEIPRPIPGWTPSTAAIATEELRVVAAAHQVLVVHCWAVWDGYDCVLDRNIRAVRSEFADTIAFRSLDVDARSARADAYARAVFIMAPMLLCYVDGSLQRRIAGVRSPEKLRELFRELVASSANG